MTIKNSYKEIKRVKGFSVMKDLGKIHPGESRYAVIGADAFFRMFKSLRAVDKFLKGSIVVMLFLCFSAYAWAVPEGINPAMAVRAIMGEAEGEPYAGKLAIGYALRNRAQIAHYRQGRVFAGVYGLNRQIGADAKAWRASRTAWDGSAKGIDITGGASVWGTDADVIEFKKTKWFQRCTFTVKIGNHNFFREP